MSASYEYDLGMSGVGTFNYDANGNRQAGPTSTYTYGVENHLAQMNEIGSGAVLLQNTYDGDGARLVRVLNLTHTTTHYVGDWYEYDPVGQVATAYYPFNGQAVAMKVGSTLYYLHRDHLGSTVAVSDVTGADKGSLRYYPFGGQRRKTGSPPTDRLFGGQIRDAVYAGDTNNDHFYFFKSRYYDAATGQFHTPDTLVPDPKDPQLLNRYAYARDNPLKLVDPTGHDSMDPNWVTQWEAAHPGKVPGDQDWHDYQFSLSHPVSGPNGTWTDADWADYTQTGYLSEQSFSRSEDFTLVGPSDQTPLPSEVVNSVTGQTQGLRNPKYFVGGSFITSTTLTHGQLYAGVHERVTGNGTQIDLSVSFVSPNPALLNPTFVATVGKPPYNSIGTLPSGRLYQFTGPAITSATNASAMYAGSVFIPRSVGMALHVSLTPNPWSPGAFLGGAGTFEFDL